LRTEIKAGRHLDQKWTWGEKRPVNRLGFFILVIALIGVTSCGSKPASTAITCSTTSGSSTTTTTSTCTDPTTNITLTISPATISLNVTTPQQFTGTLQGGTNSIVIWKVNNVQGGNNTVGRIDSSGLYNAPATVPTTNPISVTATSFEDQNLSATATVTITPAPVVTITSPISSPTVSSGTGIANQVTFSATETGGTTNSVFWEVGLPGLIPVLGGNSTFGTIDANGVYIPPLTPPVGSTVWVWAVAQDFPASTAHLPVTISGYSTSSLGGQFAFSVSGTNASGPFFRAGSFQADGAGKLNSVMETVNQASGVATGLFAGTYTVTSDGRGTLTFDDGLGPPPSNTSNFNFVLVDGTHLQLIGFDTSGTASGEATVQDLSAFAGDPLSALTGTYVFDFSGVHGANVLSQIGEFNVNVNHAISGGSMDINDGGTQTQYQVAGNQPLCGSAQPPANPSTYTVSSNGFGSLTLNLLDSSCNPGPKLTFAFYALSKGGAKFVGTDATLADAGYTAEQQLPPAGTTFGNGFLNGNYAFLLENSMGTYASAGSFSANGLGTLTGGVLDENSNGTPNPDVLLTSTTYQIGSNGRGTISPTGGRTYVFYLGPSGTAIFQETDASHASDGMLVLQQNSSFAVSQIAGNYAIATTGLSSGTPESITGEVAADGAGNISSGAADVNTGGSAAPGVALTGSYTTSPSPERGVLTLKLANPLNQTRSFGTYVVGPNQAFALEIDTNSPSHLAAGQLLRQF
jgi:hypothetical protein